MYQQPTHQFQKLLIRTESQMGGIGENEWLVLGAVQCRTLNFGFLAFFFCGLFTNGTAKIKRTKLGGRRVETRKISRSPEGVITAHLPTAHALRLLATQE